MVASSIELRTCFNRILEIDKILQQKGQAKKNTTLQKILTNLSDEIEVCTYL